MPKTIVPTPELEPVWRNSHRDRTPNGYRREEALMAWALIEHSAGREGMDELIDELMYTAPDAPINERLAVEEIEANAFSRVWRLLSATTNGDSRQQSAGRRRLRHEQLRLQRELMRWGYLHPVVDA